MEVLNSSSQNKQSAPLNDKFDYDKLTLYSLVTLTINSMANESHLPIYCNRNSEQ